MTGVQFEEERRTVHSTRKPTGMTGWLIKKGIVPNVHAANILLTVAAIALIGVSIFVTFSGAEEVVVISGQND